MSAKDKIFVASVYPDRDKYESPFFKLGFNNEDIEKLRANTNERGYANAYLQKSKEKKWYMHVLPIETEWADIPKNPQPKASAPAPSSTLEPDDFDM